MTPVCIGKPACLAAIFLAASVTIAAGQPFRAVDPGVRDDKSSAASALPGVDAQYFANTRSAFNEVHSIAGDIEVGAGLGPRFNGTSCGGCHAYPAPGGSSPMQNPQLHMALEHGARNKIPEFIRANGPVVAVRVRTNPKTGESGGVLPLFTVNGRVDAYSCAVAPPDLTNRANLSFRIPTPVFGAGLIDNIPDAVILANRNSHAAQKQKLGIHGEPNLSSTGSVGKFGWK